MDREKKILKMWPPNVPHFSPTVNIKSNSFSLLNLPFRLAGEVTEKAIGGFSRSVLEKGVESSLGGLWGKDLNKAFSRKNLIHEDPWIIKKRKRLIKVPQISMFCL